MNDVGRLLKVSNEADIDEKGTYGHEMMDTTMMPMIMADLIL